MKSDVHEAFLPSDSDEAYAVVFELQPPKAFAAWQEITWLIIHDIGRLKMNKEGQDPCVNLRQYAQLCHYITDYNDWQRLALASFTKSNLVAHYKLQSFPVSLKQLDLAHGLSYRHPFACNTLDIYITLSCVEHLLQRDLRFSDTLTDITVLLQRLCGRFDGELCASIGESNGYNVRAPLNGT